MPKILYQDVAEQELGKKIYEIHEQLKARRKPHEALKQLSIDLALPRRGDLADYAEGGTESRRGQKRGVDIYDDTAVQCLNTCVNGLQGHHISRAFSWFKSAFGHRTLRDQAQVRRWLQKNDETQYDILNRSHTFYPQIGEWMRDAVGVGDGSGYIEPNYSDATIELVVPNLWQMYHLRDWMGRLIAVHREFKMPACEAMEFFAREKGKFPEEFKTNLKDQPFTEYTFIHATYRNPEAWPGRLGNAHKEFLSFYVLCSNQKIVMRSGGYWTANPVIWSVLRNSDHDYGYGIVGDAIVSIATANQFSRILQKKGQLAIEPPYRISRDLEGSVSFAPNAQNFIDEARHIIEPILTRVDFQLAAEERDRIDEALKRHFMTRYFEMFTDIEKELKVLEIIKRSAEEAALISAFIGELNQATDMVLDRVYDIAMDAGWLYPPPPIVQDFIAGSANRKTAGRIDLDYMGQLVQIQKQVLAIEPITRALETSAPIMAAWPQTADIIDEDELFKKNLKSWNFPEECIRADEVVAKIRQMRIQRQQALENVEAVQKLVKAVPSLQKPTEAGSPLAQLTGQTA